MLATRIVLFLVTLAVVSSVSYAVDPDPLQDFCVGFDDSKSAGNSVCCLISLNHHDIAVFVNGKFCKNSEHVTPEDFVYSGLDIVGNTSNPLGSKLTLVFQNQLRGLNHQGVSTVKIELAPKGLNPPHAHPRASEIIFVYKGTMYVGFIASNPSNPNLPNKLYANILYSGDVYMFPRGTIHFQYNVGKTKAVAYASFNSQNPGVVTIVSSLFGSEPPVDPELLAKAFQVDLKNVKYLQSLTWTRNN
ncbi:germin-like protein subfamily 1 member 16 [Primulina tabacum]|uniref:germin-like protein subfamily 1 member 16 n=1 Tax=Primulina tabacum TaxID=48773 RepID=UPI003F5A7D45